MLGLKQRVAIISSHPFFSLLNAEDMTELAGLMHELPIAKDQVIVQEGDAIDCIYLIVEGTALVTRSSVTLHSHPNVMLARLSKGEAIGLMETGFFSQSSVRTATVTALSNMMLLVISINDLHHFIQHPKRLYASFRKASHPLLRLNLINRLMPFSTLNAKAIYELIGKMQEISIPANEFIFHEGDDGDSCYLLIEGNVEILRRKKTSEEVINILEAPAIFGETSILTLAKFRNVSARTIDKCTLLKLERNDFIHVLKEEEEVTQSIKFVLLSNGLPIQSPNISIAKNEEPDGHINYILKHTKENIELQITPQELAIWQVLDGQHTIQDIFHDERFNKKGTQEIEHFLQKLTEEKFIDIICPVIKSNFLQRFFSRIIRIFKKFLD